MLGGFRYLRLRETYNVNTDSVYIPPFPSDIWDTNDRFETTNNFYGAQGGIRARIGDGAFFATGSLKIALGAMAQKVDINGSLVTNDFNNFGPTTDIRRRQFRAAHQYRQLLAYCVCGGARGSVQPG